MRDLQTPAGTQAMCSIYQPPPAPESHAPNAAEDYHDPTSSSGSDAEWEPESSSARIQRPGAEEVKLRVREKNKAAQRRWRQNHKASTYS